MRRTIAIVGAGFSGTLVAVHLLRQGLGDRLRVVLIERKAPFGRGLAYGTWDDNLLLNVPAGNMSALVEEPGHFLTYIRTIDPNFNSGSFLPRRIYGDYLEDVLGSAQHDSDSVLEKIAGEAVALRRGVARTGYTVDLADGRRIAADQVVLALGHGPPANMPTAAGLAGTGAYVADPWDGAALERLGRGRPVALLGTGHTAIDTLFRLSARKGPGPCLLISRRGLLPHPHRRTPRQPSAVALPAYLAEGPGATVRAYLRAVRRQVRQRQAAGEDWRDVVNELRPHTPALWQQLPLAERRRFIDRVQPYWDIHRHRLAPSAHLRLQRLLDAGHAWVLAGRILGYETRGDDIAITLRRRRDGRMTRVTVGAVVNCTGPDYDLGRTAQPLLQQLRKDGLLQADALGQGLQVDGGYRVVGRDGRPAADLFYLGPLLKAALWEAIAVPELRVHAARLVRELIAANVPGVDEPDAAVPEASEAADATPPRAGRGRSGR